MAQLRAEGKVVHCIAKTHLACKNFQMGCETADHWCIKRVQNGDCRAAQYLLVEEGSQINVQLWADICVAKQRGLVIICLADFGQFEAIAQHWAGTPVEPHALQESAMLREMWRQPLHTDGEQEVRSTAVRLHPKPAPRNAKRQSAGRGAGRSPCALPQDSP